jgi:ankyrin repeat protein
MIELLLQNGADAGLKDSHSQSALFYAAKDGRIEIVKLLVNQVNNINELDFFNQTPIYYAC